MALHPKERKRLKRQKVKEAKRRHEEKIGESVRLEDYYWLAADCHEDGDHAGALKWAVKILEARPSRDEAWEIAWRSARSLGDTDKCLSLLAWRWRAGQIGNWKERFSVGQFALEQKDYRLASEIFESVLKDPHLVHLENNRKPSSSREHWNGHSCGSRKVPSPPHGADQERRDLRRAAQADVP